MVDVFVFICMVAAVGVVRYNTSHEHTPTCVNKMSPISLHNKSLTIRQMNAYKQQDCQQPLHHIHPAAARGSHSAVEASMEISNLVCQRKLPCLVSIVSV